MDERNKRNERSESAVQPGVHEAQAPGRDAARGAPSDEEIAAAGGDPRAPTELGGTASHHRPSFNDPVAGYPDPVLGTSGLSADTHSTVGKSSGSPDWMEQPVDQGGRGAHIGDPASTDRAAKQEQPRTNADGREQQ